MKKINREQLKERKQKAQAKREREESLKRELSGPVPRGINNLQDRVEKLEEYLGLKEG